MMNRVKQYFKDNCALIVMGLYSLNRDTNSAKACFGAFPHVEASYYDHEHGSGVSGFGTLRPAFEQ